MFLYKLCKRPYMSIQKKCKSLLCINFIESKSNNTLTLANFCKIAIICTFHFLI